MPVDAAWNVEVDFEGENIPNSQQYQPAKIRLPLQIRVLNLHNIDAGSWIRALHPQHGKIQHQILRKKKLKFVPQLHQHPHHGAGTHYSPVQKLPQKVHINLHIRVHREQGETLQRHHRQQPGPEQGQVGVKKDKQVQIRQPANPPWAGLRLIRASLWAPLHRQIVIRIST